MKQRMPLDRLREIARPLWHPSAPLPDARSLMLILLALVPVALAAAYISAYGQNVPLGDQWHLGSRIAFAASDGSLRLSDLTYMDDGHRTVFTNLTTAIMTVLTRWNIKAEMLLNLALVGGCYALLILLLKRMHTPWIPLTMVVMSALFFSLNRETSWLQWRHSGWNFAILFLLSALYALNRLKETPAVFIAMAATFCATFSTAIGILVWPVVVVTMWMHGCRRWWLFALCIAAALVSAWLYLSGSSIAIGSVEGSREQVMNSLQIPDPAFLARFTAVYLARAITGFQQYFDFMMTVSAVGILWFSANVTYLWRTQHNRHLMIIWLSLALYSLAAPLLIAQGRSFLDLGHALTVQYVAVSSLFWAACVGLAMITVYTIAAKAAPNGIERLLFFANLILAVTLTGLYVYSNIVAVQRSATYWEHPLELQGASDPRPEEQCLRAFLFSRDTTCMEALLPRSTIIDPLAARRLSIFAEQTPVSILPPTYQQGSPILIAAGHAWLNVHIRDWLLAGIAEEHLIHLVPNNAEALDVIQALPEPLQRVVAQNTRDLDPAFDAVAGDASEVWLVRAAAVRAPVAVRDLLQARGFVSMYAEQLTEPMPLEIKGFAQLEEPTRVLFRVGQSLTLEGWSLETAADVRPCTSIPVTTLWLTNSALPQNLSMTVVLADASGVGVVRNDAPPAGLEMERWLVNQLYMDRRALVLPCDLAPGSYSLLVGIYDYASGQSLEAQTTDGTAVGGLIYLTSVRVPST